MEKSGLALPLLVFGILADDVHLLLSAHLLAILAPLFD